MSEHNQVIESGTAAEQVRSAESTRVEQRRHHRLTVNLDIQVSWVDSFGFQNEADAVVKNISAGGFGIHFSHNRPLGSRLTVKSETNSMACVVRHSQPIRGQLYLGLEVLPSVHETATSRSLESLSSALSGAGEG